MSNVQVYFAVGVPSVLVILAWLQANQRAGRIETVMGNLAKNMRSEMITLRDSIHRDMIPLHERMARLEERKK